MMSGMEQRITIKFIPDPEGVTAITEFSGMTLSAFGCTPATATENLVRKVKFILHPTAAPPPREITI
jgi:hypothetical protein